MLRKLLAFEVSLQTKQVGFWITCLILCFFGFLLTGTDIISTGSEGGERVKLNGAISLAENIGLLSLLSLFFGAVFTVTGVMRDENHKFLEIIHATPIKTFDMAFSRMSGVAIVTFLCILAGVIGMAAGQFSPWADKEAFGPFIPGHWLYSIVFYVGINALLVSSIYMFIAALTRNKALVYVSAVGLFMLYNAVGIFLGENSPDLTMTLAEPFGLAPLSIVTEFWTPLEKNTQNVPLIGYFGLNRLVYSVFAVGLFIVTLARYKRGMVQNKTKRKKAEKDAETQPLLVTTLTPDHSARADLAGFTARTKLEYMAIIKSVPFIILSCLALALFISNIYFAIEFTPDATLPTSAFMSNLVLGSFGLSMLIISVFFGGDIMWRERTVNIHEILDATPVKNTTLTASKWTALGAVILTLIVLGVVCGVAAQLLLGGTDVHLGTYLRIGIGSFGIIMLVNAALVMFLQNFMPGRVIGMLVAGGFIVGLAFISMLPFYHPLFDFGSGTTMGAYSEINGFNGLTNFSSWMTYWGGLLLLFFVSSIWLWRRGTETSLRSRLRGLRAQFGPATGALAALGLASFISFGGLIYKRYNVDQDYRNSKAAEKRIVAFEKMVLPLADINTPKIRSVEADVNFKPSKQSAVVKGRYVMENWHDTPIETLYVKLASDHPEDNRLVEIDGAVHDTQSKDIEQLEDYGYRRYTFSPPLAPGATTQMRFETYFHPPRLGDGSSILKNGTFVNNSDVMPFLGIAKNFLSDPDKRRKFDLGERERAPARTDEAARQYQFFDRSSDYVDFQARMCTDIGQIAIAPGTLIKTYEENGQACRDYKSNVPIANFFSFVSQDFTEERDIWTGENGQSLPIVIYYHASHNYNVDLMMAAAKKSMDVFTQTYGPYHYEQVRIMEFPYRSFAQSFAGTIPFSENIGFVQNPGDPEDPESVDLATYVTMHEIGHQWFGHQIMPAYTKGFNVLSEGLTENAAMTAYEQELGWGKARRILKQRSIQGYLTGRTSDKENEVSLATVENKGYMDYNKANWVFWGLRKTVGADIINGAMKNLVDEFGYSGPPYPTSLDVVRHLTQAVGPEYAQLVSDYWDRITLWKLEFAEEAPAAVSETEDGRFEVVLNITVDKRVTSEEDGKDASVQDIDGVTLDELIEIGFYAEDPTEALGGGWIAKERVRVSDVENTLTFTLSERPTHILLDPQRLLIERNHKDNLHEIDADLAEPAN